MVSSNNTVCPLGLRTTAPGAKQWIAVTEMPPDGGTLYEPTSRQAFSIWGRETTASGVLWLLVRREPKRDAALSVDGPCNLIYTSFLVKDDEPEEGELLSDLQKDIRAVQANLAMLLDPSLRQ